MIAPILFNALFWVSCQMANSPETTTKVYMDNNLPKPVDSVKKGKELSPVSMNKKTIPNWITKEYLMGKFPPASQENFEQLDLKHCSAKGMYLRKEAYTAFKEMYDAAKKDGITLRIISATRNFEAQKSIWEAKWTGGRLVGGKNLSTAIKDAEQRARKILEYSSMPGTSRHHWGTDMDLNSLENSFFAKGEGKKIYDWLTANAATYGFCQPYSNKAEGRTGYEEEKWHWSYTPLSRDLTNHYDELLNNEDITGFKGHETAVSIDAIANYVLGINPVCK